MEEQLGPVAVTHLLQHTLRSLCTGGGGDAASPAPQWVYAVFWRILPRNYPPPKWDLPGAAYDRTRGNRRNWILAWEDGFCNFAAANSCAAACGQEGAAAAAAVAYAGDCEAAAAAGVQQDAVKHQQQPPQPGLQPELFFKMSHDIYNYGEGLIGKVAADHSHKWVFKDPQEHEINLISSWTNPADSHPRTWEAQFQSGIQTIALIAVREGVVQLGSMKKVAEDLSYVVMLRRKFGYLESIPGVLLPHPSSAGVFPGGMAAGPPPDIAAAAAWPPAAGMMPPPPHGAAGGPALELYDPYGCGAGPAAAAAASMHIMPSMSSLEALLSKLPSVVMPAPQPAAGPSVAPALMPQAKDVEGDGYVQCHGMDDDDDDDVAASNAGAAAGDEMSTSTSAAAAAATAPTMSSYFVNVGSRSSNPGEGQGF